MTNATLRTPGTVVKSTEPKIAIPTLIAHLRSLGDRGETKANWIEDVYSEVLKGLHEGMLPDLSWIDDLLDMCCKQLNAVAQAEPELRDRRFGEYRTGEWGWREVGDDRR